MSTGGLHWKFFRKSLWYSYLGTKFFEIYAVHSKPRLHGRASTFLFVLVWPDGCTERKGRVSADSHVDHVLCDPVPVNPSHCERISNYAKNVTGRSRVTAHHVSAMLALVAHNALVPNSVSRKFNIVWYCIPSWLGWFLSGSPVKWDLPMACNAPLSLALGYVWLWPSARMLIFGTSYAKSCRRWLIRRFLNVRSWNKAPASLESQELIWQRLWRWRNKQKEKNTRRLSIAI